MEQKYKYECHPCDFHTNNKILLEKHIRTELHRNGKRKIRCDKKCLDKCPSCDYTSKSNITMNHHILTKHKTKEEREKEFKYYCKRCDYGTFTKSLFDRHSLSTKHNSMKNIL